MPFPLGFFFFSLKVCGWPEDFTVIKNKVNILIALTALNVFGVFGGFSLMASFPGLMFKT